MSAKKNTKSAAPAVKPPKKTKSAQNEAQPTAETTDQVGQITAETPISEATVDTAIEPALESAPAASKPKKLSALDAAAQVLAQSSRAMNCPELIQLMSAQELWRSPKGLTPHATLYAAILREISEKGEKGRFRKVERGTFALNIPT